MAFGGAGPSDGPDDAHEGPAGEDDRPSFDPGVASGARANRQFLARAVRHLAGEAGRRRVVRVEEWRPVSDLEGRNRSAMWGGAARKN